MIYILSRHKPTLLEFKHHKENKHLWNNMYWKHFNQVMQHINYIHCFGLISRTFLDSWGVERWNKRNTNFKTQNAMTTLIISVLATFAEHLISKERNSCPIAKEAITIQDSYKFNDNNSCHTYFHLFAQNFEELNNQKSKYLKFFHVFPSEHELNCKNSSFKLRVKGWNNHFENLFQKVYNYYRKFDISFPSTFAFFVFINCLFLRCTMHFPNIQRICGKKRKFLNSFNKCTSVLWPLFFCCCIVRFE